MLIAKSFFADYQSSFSIPDAPAVTCLVSLSIIIFVHIYVLKYIFAEILEEPTDLSYPSEYGFLNIGPLLSCILPYW